MQNGNMRSGAAVAGTPQDLKGFLRTATPKSLTEWADRLPRSNPSALAQQVMQALTALDELDMQPMQKFTLLDVLRLVAYQTVEALTAGFMGSAASCSEEVRAIINKAMALQGQLVSAYTSVAASARLQGSNNLFIMGGALHRALADQFTMLSFYLQLHLPVPSQLWKQLHRLFKVAEDAQLLTHVMGDNVFLNEQMLTIKQLYLSALLLGCARTQHMASDDVAVVAKALKKWVLHAEVSRHPVLEQPHQLAVDVDSGNAPAFDKAEVFAEPRNWRFLNTRRLVAQLQKPGAAIAVKLGVRNVTVSDELLRHLALAWSEYVGRETDRVERNDMINTSIGLDALHYYLTGVQELESFIGELRHPVDPARKMRVVVGDVPAEFNFRAYRPADLDGQDQSRYPCHRIRVVNQSPGGYCLEWPVEVQGGLLVGEVIGLREAYAPYWKICEIVWMKKSDDGKAVRTGVRTLGNEAIPLVARRAHYRAAGEDEVGNVPGLLLPADRDLGAGKTTLLVPNIQLRTGEQVRVVQEGNERAVQLLDAVKETRAYSQFECAWLVDGAQ